MSKHYFNNRISSLKPYTLSKRFDVDDDDDILALDWNESLFGPSERVRRDLINFLSDAKLNLYPDGDLGELKQAISDYIQVQKNYILTYNGSDSAIRDCMFSLISESSNVGVIEPEYNQVDTFIHMAGGKKVSIFPNDIFTLDIGFICNEIFSKKVEYLYISNPSNPVGRQLTRSDIERILDTGVMLLLDEAYVEFADESCVNMVSEYVNLIVFRTFSKAFGIASLRMGYICSNEKNISLISKVRNPKEINLLSQVAALSSLQNVREIQLQISEMTRVKNWFVREINSIETNIKAINSKTNFVLITTPNSREILENLRGKNIYVRDRSAMHQLENTLRITIGPMDEMKKIVDIIKKVEVK